MAKVLRIIPLGGLGEIGKSMLALEYANDIIVIDAGVMFPEEDMPGVDLVIPNISYLEERRKNVRAIFITHGHEDHTGALPYVLPRLNVPVFAPRLAHGLIQVKLREHHLLDKVRLEQVEPGQSIRQGAFRVEFFRVCHSIPDAMGLAIETPLGLVLHSGDFKIDHTPVDGLPTDFAKLSALTAKGVFLLFSDSTYAETPGYTPSERTVGEALDQIIGDAPGRVMVATFASLISRVQLVLEAARKHNRKVALVGRSMVDNVTMAIKMGYLRAPGGVLRTLKEIKSLPPERLVIVTTGAQGEPTSALTRMANRDHREIEVMPGDTIVLSASPIPGNETVISRTIDNLYRQKARVLSMRNAPVHVHGHASQEELKLLLRLARPRYFVPVHGEYRHLVAHAELARSMGVAEANAFVLEDGDVLELMREKGAVVERIPCGHIYVDGLRLWERADTVLRERQALARDGVVVVTLTVDGGARRLAKRPELVSSGFVDAEAQRDLMQRGSEALMEALDDAGHIDSPSDLTEQVREILGKFLYNETGRRPTILSVSMVL
jgi:ribonuclease J